jgi:hypothetical protein
MRTITDEFMRQMLLKSKQYSVVILKAGPNKGKDRAEKITWEHGRETSHFVQTECYPLCVRPPTGVTSQALAFLMPQ